MSTSSFHDNLNQEWGAGFSNQLEAWSKDLGFSNWGATSLESPVSLEFYRQWIAQNYQGEMDYLKRHLPMKENPKLLNERFESALVFAYAYVPHPKPWINENSELRTALYAQGEDYHYWLKERLEKIASQLRAQYPDEVFICLTDSSPVLERDLAYRAGLGWVGKNSCLIDPENGSLFLIGEILTSLKLTQKPSLVHDFCGTCTRCLDVCPTGALEKPRVLNAQKCISYLTIESRQIPPETFRKGIGDLFFGCDLCQTTCPWNEKAFRGKPEAQVLEKSNLRELPLERLSNLQTELREILSLSGKQLEKKFSGSPLKRAGPFGLRRNALLVAANQKLSELRPEIQTWCEDEKLGDLARWALQELDSQHP
jgi:epoxyqueuosine reductase